MRHNKPQLHHDRPEQLPHPPPFIVFTVFVASYSRVAAKVRLRQIPRQVSQNQCAGKWEARSVAALVDSCVEPGERHVFGLAWRLWADKLVVFGAEGGFLAGVGEVDFDVHANFVWGRITVCRYEVPTTVPVAVVFRVRGGREVVAAVGEFGDMDVVVDEVFPHFLGLEKKFAADVGGVGFFP